MSNLRLFDPMFTDGSEPFFKRFFSPMRFELEPEPSQIRVDVEESDKSYLVSAELPGVKKEDIHVRIDGHVVQIDAQTKREKETKEHGKLLRSERYWGAVSRSFSLAQDIDQSHAQAKYDNGVLKLDLPKNKAAVRKICRFNNALRCWGAEVRATACTKPVCFYEPVFMNENGCRPA